MAMLKILAARPYGVTARDLAQELGVSARTVQRDLRDVQDEPLRTPLYQDERWRWRMLER